MDNLYLWKNVLVLMASLSVSLWVDGWTVIQSIGRTVRATETERYEWNSVDESSPLSFPLVCLSLFGGWRRSLPLSLSPSFSLSLHSLSPSLFLAHSLTHSLLTHWLITIGCPFERRLPFQRGFSLSLFLKDE